MQDLTIVYYTANYLGEKKPDFWAHTLKTLIKAIGKDTPMVMVAQKPTMFAGLAGADLIVVGEIGRSHLNIYRQALEGARAAKTKYIALVEDDVLYHEDHFKYRPPEGTFGYNLNVWSIFTWVKPAIFNYKSRINLSGLICERDLFIDAMEERFDRHPDDSKTDISIWAEPGKYEKYLKVTEQKIQTFYSDTPNVAFSHETALSYLNLGTRKKMGQPRATAIPYWGTAEEVLKLYENV